MTSERAEAYGQLMRRIRTLGAQGLLPHEEEQIREAADVLLFCTEHSSQESAQALADARRLVEGLVKVGRWRQEAARRLLRDLEACGPLAPVA
jgi:hypothetical protein